MKKSKLVRLRRAGWKVGSVQEFLALSDEEMALIDLKLGLADIVRAERERLRLTQASLAGRIGSSQSRIAKLEAGAASVSLDLMVRAAFNLGLSPLDLGKRITRLERSRRTRKRAG